MSDTKMVKIIDAIFDVLPATDYQDITKRVNSTKRWSLGIGTISNALSTLRRDPKTYGYTVPHVKRGLARRRKRNEKRLFAVLCDRDGNYELDNNPEARAHLENGAMSTAQHAGTMLGNEAFAIRLSATATRERNLKAKLNDLADDFEFVSRKAKAIVRELKTLKAA